MVECQLPKLDVAGSNPVSRSIFNNLQIPQFRRPSIKQRRLFSTIIFVPLTAPKSLRLLIAGFDVQLEQLELYDCEWMT